MPVDVDISAADVANCAFVAEGLRVLHADVPGAELRAELRSRGTEAHDRDVCVCEALKVFLNVRPVHENGRKHSCS